ncbi:hypothetical protein [Xanthobacter autotrophicus]|uniref:hypothetical protein n=1 Tax=Xanthobacter autotrophicus TaxID=280 RepID=UPI00372A4EC8
MEKSPANAPNSVGNGLATAAILAELLAHAAGQEADATAWLSAIEERLAQNFRAIEGLNASPEQHGAVVRDALAKVETVFLIAKARTKGAEG